MIVLTLLPLGALILYRIDVIHPASTLMMADWVRGKPVDRRWVEIDDISPALWQSVMMSEDARFCSHYGVDWDQVDQVLTDALAGERTRGASTIPMQTVKNLFLWNSRSFLRKAVEVPLAIAADVILGKRRLLEIYLNIAEWGPGIYGAEAAAQRHFKRPAHRLSRRQAAFLAVSLPNPHIRKPSKPSRGLSRLARVIERRAKASGAYIGCIRR